MMLNKLSNASGLFVVEMRLTCFIFSYFFKKKTDVYAIFWNEENALQFLHYMKHSIVATGIKFRISELQSHNSNPALFADFVLLFIQFAIEKYAPIFSTKGHGLK